MAMQEAIHGLQVSTVVLPTLASSAATINYDIFYAFHDVEVHGIIIACSGAVTGADTNTVHINIDEMSTADVATERVTYDLTSGNDLTTADKPYELFSTSLAGGSDSVITLSAGEYLRWEYEEIGTGLGAAIGNMTVFVLWRCIDSTAKATLTAAT